MDLTRLFEIQRKLDAEIEEKHPTAAGEDRLAKRILALQVELGECANEWRGFKFWSTNQKSNNCVRTTKGATKGNVIELFCSSCGDSTGKEHEWFEKILKDDYNKCLHCGEPQVNFMTEINPLLEEYVDCLHFILSIGNHIEMEVDTTEYPFVVDNEVEYQFLSVMQSVSSLGHLLRFGHKKPFDTYNIALMQFINLGKMLNFTEDIIIEAYMSKNAINHQRQAEGY